MRSFLRLLFALSLTPLFACGGDDDGAGAGTVAFIEIQPGGQLLTPDRQSATLTAVAYDADGNPVTASFTWTSSTPDQVAVDEGGTISAVSELGSATIVAEADGIRSNPVVVATVELHPGTLVVTDDQVVEIGEASLPDGAEPGDFPLVDVRLRGIDPPAAGTLIVSAEGSALGGSVISAEADGAEVAVRLQSVALPELYARYDIDWQLDVAGYGVEEDEEASTARIAAAVRPIEQKLEKQWPRTGPFRCTGSISAFLEKNFVDLKLAGEAKFILKSSRLDSSQPPGYLKVAIEGPITVKGSLALKAKAGLQAAGKCELKGRIPISLGFFGAIVSPAIPLGVGVALDAKLIAASMELGFEGENGIDLGIGFECGPSAMRCRSLDRVDWISRFKPLLDVPRGMKDSRVELSAKAYFLTGIDFLVAFRWPIEAVEVTIGPVQSANLAFVDNQLDDRGYASAYDLKLEGKLAPGASVDKIIKKFLGDDAESGRLGAELSVAYPLSKSPIGVMTADKGQVLPNEKVKFRVDLAADSLEYFLLGWNVSAILFYQKHADEPTYKLAKELPVSSSGTRFEWEWTPTSADAGQNEFYAMVKTSLPVIELEIGVDSGRKVEVTGVCLPPAGLAGLGAVPGGSDSCQLTGTASHTEVISGPDIDMTTRMDANVTLQLDPDQTGGGQLVFVPYGNWTGSHGGTTSGCTISTTPLGGFLDAGPDQGTFWVWSGSEQYPDDVYAGSVSSGLVPTTITYNCPGNDPIEMESMMALVAFSVTENQAFVLDPETRRATGTYTIEGSDGINTTTHTFTWDLVLETPPPPPLQ